MGKPKRIPVKEAKDSEVQKLKNRVRRLEKDKAKLLSEVRTLEAYFKKTQMHVEGLVGSEPVEKLIKAAQEKKPLNEIKKDVIKMVCKRCLTGEVIVHKGSYGELKMCQNTKCNHVERS